MPFSALNRINYGVYIVSSKKDAGSFNGQIANVVFQVTSEPKQIAICINTQNYTHQFISQSGVFSVSVLSKDTPMPFIGRFGFKSGTDIDKYAGLNITLAESGAPVVLDHTVAWLDAKVVSRLDLKTHTLFVGEVTGSCVVSDDEPMTYDHYKTVKKGKAPATAPTYSTDLKAGLGS